MKITLKTLQGKQLPLDVEPDMTVDEMKAKIAVEHEMPAAQQNLVAYGKVLGEGEKPISSYGIKDGDFIVVMVKKAKPAPKVQPPKEEPKVEDKPAEVVKESEKDKEVVQEEPKPVPSQPVQ